jgi:hypothetical protein
MPAFVRKSLETDKERKALEAQTPENRKSRHRKQAKGKNASVTHALVQTEACLPKDVAGNFISEQ